MTGTELYELYTRLESRLAAAERRNQALERVLGAYTAMPQRTVTDSVNELYARGYSARRSFDDPFFAVSDEAGTLRGLYICPRNGSVSSAARAHNTRLLTAAFNAAVPLEMPRLLGVIEIDEPVRVRDLPVDLRGFSEGAIIRQCGEGPALIIDNSSRLNTVKIDSVIFESGYQYNPGFAVRIEGSFGRPYDDEVSYDRPDDIVIKSSGYIVNCEFRGSEQYFTARPWGGKTWNGAIYWENPQSVLIENNRFIGRGENYFGAEAYKGSEYGIYFVADRLSTDATVRNNYITNCKKIAYMLGDGRLFTLEDGRVKTAPTLEGVKFHHNTFLSGDVCIWIENKKYGAPGFEIIGGNYSANRYILYGSNIRQSTCAFMESGYLFGHDNPGICVGIYLNNACSEWVVVFNKLRYLGAPERTKKPYGMLVSGFNKQQFYGDWYELAPGEDPIEYAVANKVFFNQFIGPGGAYDLDAMWFQDNAIQNEIDWNNQEAYARTLRCDLAQNRVGENNSPRDPVQGGVVPIVHQEKSVIEIPLLDPETNDPVFPPQTVKRVVNRQNEGAVLMPWSGTVVAVRKSSGGLAVPFSLLPGEASNSKAIGDFWFARSPLIEIRENYVAGIDYSDPDNPAEIIMPYEGNGLAGFSVRYGQKFRLEARIPVRLYYDEDLLPLRGGVDIVLMPGEFIVFENTINGIEELARYTFPIANTTLSEVETGRDWIIEDEILPDLDPAWRVTVERYEGVSGGTFERQVARNLLKPYRLERIVLNGTEGPWQRSDAAVMYADDINGFLPAGTYHVTGALYPGGETSWVVAELGSPENSETGRVQRAVSASGRWCITRRMVAGIWQGWQRDGSQLSPTGQDQLQDGTYMVYVAGGKVQLLARSGSDDIELDYTPAEISDPAAYPYVVVMDAGNTRKRITHENYKTYLDSL